MDVRDPTAVGPGGTIRFRVEDAGRNLQSSTWSVVGSKRTGDLYFSCRAVMGDLKLSLHQSGIARMAWTDVAASSRVAPDQDRVFSRWKDLEPAPGGWKCVLVHYLPDSTLGQALPPLPGRKGKPTVTIPAVGPGRVVAVRVFVGRPGSGNIRVEGSMGEIGRMILGDGSRVLVTAWNLPTTANLEAEVVAIRARAMEAGAKNRVVPRSWGWGNDAETGIPMGIDTGDPRPHGDIPETVPRYDGPPNTSVHKMRPTLGDDDSEISNDPPVVG